MKCVVCKSETKSLTKNRPVCPKCKTEYMEHYKKRKQYIKIVKGKK